MAYIEAGTKRLVADVKALGLISIAAPGLEIAEEELLIEYTASVEGTHTAVYSGVTGGGKGFVLTYEYFDLETRDA